MPDTDAHEFTEREKFILSYYRSGQAAASHRRLGYDLTFGLVSVVCVVLAVAREEIALWFVAYTLLFGRLYYLVTEGSRYSKDFQSIFAKYDAKPKALTEARQQGQSGHSGASEG